MPPSLYERLLTPPPPPGPGVCATCHGPAPSPARLCASCARLPGRLDVVLPVSLSPAGSALAGRLRGYKDHPCSAARDGYTRMLAATLERFLSGHEACLAAAAGIERLDLAATVPSRRAVHDQGGGRLELIAARLCAPTAARHAGLLEPGPHPGAPRAWSPGRYRARRALGGEGVLLIDDTWTSGASAQAAADALRHAGAGHVCLVVIGRHLQAAGGAGQAALEPFRWDRCALGPGCLVAGEAQPRR